MTAEAEHATWDVPQTAFQKGLIMSFVRRVRAMITHVCFLGHRIPIMSSLICGLFSFSVEEDDRRGIAGGLLPSPQLRETAPPQRGRHVPHQGMTFYAGLACSTAFGGIQRLGAGSFSVFIAIAC
jgi:hypothetical protein